MKKKIYLGKNEFLSILAQTELGISELQLCKLYEINPDYFYKWRIIYARYSVAHIQKGWNKKTRRNSLVSMKQQRIINSSNRLSKNSNVKKLFIDCGGHDGCSAIKFKLNNPDFDIVTFEGNPELWVYYNELPTKLVKKLVYTYDGVINFIVDPIDADGSSIIKEKRIDFYRNIENENCPNIEVPCIDLSRYIQQKRQEYDEIILKLDVEGAEYEILDKMIKDDTIRLVDKLYIEFHWEKINLSEDKHHALLKKLGEIVSIDTWDALEFSVHKRDALCRKLRRELLKVINQR